MKGEKKKKSVEKCKGADVKDIPENSIYLSRVSCVLLGHVSTVGHFKLKCKLLKFSLSDINSKLTDDE